MKTPMQSLLCELYDNSSEGWYHVDELREFINKHMNLERVELQLAHKAGQELCPNPPTIELSEQYYENRFVKKSKTQPIADEK